MIGAHLRGPRSRAAGAAVLLLSLAAAACDRERRDFRSDASHLDPGATVRMTELQPGPPSPDPRLHVYDNSAWAIAEGQRLYAWFNCAGCHAPGGGGAMGPPLIDDEWIYGSNPENIFRTIQDGRPNGMPSFGGRISTGDTWKLVAYVRQMGERTRPDTWSGRADRMESANPEPEEGPARDTEPDSARRER